MTDTVVIGAGPSGLAVSACLRRAGIRFIQLEQNQGVGSAWRSHYDRLHLHTSKRYSSLPHLPFPEDYPRYPSRLQVVAYLERYAKTFELEPRFGETVTSARPRDGGWEVETERSRIRSRHLVVASGYNCQPNLPTWPGQATFHGPVTHSREFRNGAALRGKRVLVVGLGNSGGEIAIDLVEHGALTFISVRSPVHVSARDFLGIPAQSSALLMSRIPIRIADPIATAAARLAVGDLSRYGIRRPQIGIIRQLVEHGRVPLVDIGTIALIKQGKIEVVPGIDRFTAQGVHLTDQRHLPVDAVILATGYRPRLDRFLENAQALTDSRGYPRWHGVEAPVSGLYFIGYRNPLTGALHDISIEARRIAADITEKGPVEAR